MVRADLEADAARLLDPGWLSSQRWYGANDRRLLSVSLADAAPMALTGGPAAWLLVLRAAFGDGATTSYLVPAVADADGLREPRDGDGAWTALASAILDHAVLTGQAGAFRGEPASSAEDLAPGWVGRIAAGDAGGVTGPGERRLGVEQTNTSVALGDRLILKLYRRLEPGENPELEVGTFLESVGCRVVPRMAGAMRYLAEVPSAAALLQERIPTSGDAWRQLTALLGGEGGGPEAALAEVGRIGTVTAELHAALAARPDDLAFPVRFATEEERLGWQQAAVRLADRAQEVVTGSDAERLAAVLPAVRERIDHSLAAAGSARVTRIHGDYHLGQLLCRDDGGYAVIDFEGEPARPLALRRAAAPPERDVAGMLRSLDYAARTTERRATRGFAADAWLARARVTFLSAYRAEAPVPPEPNLLEAFELEKACYELVYEAASRPDWTWLPLDALRRYV